MKKIITSALFLSVSAFLIGLATVDGNITGKVTPAANAESVWAIDGKDTVKSAVMDGHFTLAVKPAIYKVIVNAKEPYKAVVLQNVEVRFDETVNLGDIELKQ